MRDRLDWVTSHISFLGSPDFTPLTAVGGSLAEERLSCNIQVDEALQQIEKMVLEDSVSQEDLRR